MAHFSGKIINAYYTNQNHDTVCVMWSDGQVAREHYVVVDENDGQFKELLDYENLLIRLSETKQFTDNVSQEFKDAFERYAVRNNLYGYGEDGSKPEKMKEDEAVVTGSLDQLIFNFNANDNEQKEQLFKLKLKLFEEDVVKSSKKRTAKADLRKAETPVEAISAYAKFL